jgi:hypothetical protein
MVAFSVMISQPFICNDKKVAPANSSGAATMAAFPPEFTAYLVAEFMYLPVSGGRA